MLERVIRNGALYINSIREVLQCRPTFRDVAPSNLNASDSDAEGSGSNSDGEEMALHQVALKRKESEKAQAIRLQSYSHVRAQEDAEEWSRLTIHQQNSTEAIEAFKNLSRISLRRDSDERDSAGDMEIGN